MEIGNIVCHPFLGQTHFRNTAEWKWIGIFGMWGFLKCFQHDSFAADDADVLPIILDNATAIPYRNTGEPLQTNSERIESDDTIVCTAAICRQ